MSGLIQLDAVSELTREGPSGDLNDFGGFVECPDALGFEIEGKLANASGDNQFDCDNPGAFETGPSFKG